MRPDRLMPEFDAIGIEHRVTNGRRADVYGLAIHIGFLDVVCCAPIVCRLFALRTAAERAEAMARRSQVVSRSERGPLPVGEVREIGDWGRLDDRRATQPRSSDDLECPSNRAGVATTARTRVARVVRLLFADACCLITAPVWALDVEWGCDARFGV